MSKRKNLRHILVISAFFILALICFNILDSLLFHVLGVALIIAAVYGIVCLGKKCL